VSFVEFDPPAPSRPVVLASTDNGRLAHLETPTIDPTAEVNAKTELGHDANALFGHVAMTWLRKTRPLSELRADVAADATKKVDVKVLLDGLKVGHRHLRQGLTLSGAVNGDSIIWPMRTSAAEQLGARLKIPSAAVGYHLEQGEDDLLAESMTRALGRRQIADDEGGGRPTHFLVRGKQTQTALGNEVQARAILSSRYAVLDNSDVVDALDDLFRGQNVEARSSHEDWNGDSLNFNLLLPDTYTEKPNDSGYASGVTIANNEVGGGSVRVEPFLFRVICVNGIIWSRTGLELNLKQRHVGVISPRMLKAQIAQVLDRALPFTAQIVENLELAKQVPIPNLTATIATLCRDMGLPKSTGNNWAKGYLTEARTTEAFRGTAFAVVNGLTRAAQELDAEGRRNLERMAGNILMPRNQREFDVRWEGIRDRAKTLSRDEVNQYVTIAVA